MLQWGRAETFLLSMIGISNFLIRAECCVTKSTFLEESTNVTKDVTTMRTCLQSIVKSTSVTALFAMVMQIGNYLNYGTSKGAQRGFSLDTLQLLMRVEGFDDKSYSLMRFIMDSLEGDKKLRDEALEDMKKCEEASKIDFDEAVRQLAELEKNVTKVADAVTPTATEGASSEGATALAKIGDAQFESAMRVFVTGAQKQLSALREQVNEVTELIKQCVDMFAEKPKTPIVETMLKFATFRKDMEQARRHNLEARVKKEKAEKRRLERENAAKAKAKATPKSAGSAAPKRGAGASSSTASAATAAGRSSKKEETAGSASTAMRKLKLTVPDRPHLAHALPRSGGATSSRQPKSPRETSAGLVLDGSSSLPLPVGRMTIGPGSRPGLGSSHLDASASEPIGRRTVGPGSRPEILRVSGSGRISVGVAANAGGAARLLAPSGKAVAPSTGAAPVAPGSGAAPGAG